jgi:hypothetical protein
MKKNFQDKHEKQKDNIFLDKGIRYKSLLGKHLEQYRLKEK